MRFFGITVGDLLALVSLVTVIFGAMASLFKMVVVDRLTDSLDDLTNQLKESASDRRALHKNLGKLEDRVIRVEGKQEAHEHRYEDHLQFYHGKEHHHEQD